MKKRILSYLLSFTVLIAFVPVSTVHSFEVVNLFNNQRVSVGETYTAVIKNDDSLWIWGANGCGQLGDGTLLDKHHPVKTMDNVQSISAGFYHAAAIKKDGSLWTWGGNSNGQIGDGTTDDKYTPTKIMDNVAAVSAGYTHTTAIKKDGSLWTWGDNPGDGTTDDKYRPIKIMDDVIAVSTGYHATAAIKSDNTLWGWGDIYGDANIGSTPQKIMDNVRSVVLSELLTLVIKTDGSLWGWGRNDYYQLGDGTNEYRDRPIKIMDNVASVTAGDSHVMAIKTDGSLWAWGGNYDGQVGNGTKPDYNIPSTLNVSKPQKIMNNVSAVSAGGAHTVARKKDGTFWTWGLNYWGQLGDDSTIDKCVPINIIISEKSPVGVHTTNKNNIANNIESDLNSLLSSITLCDTTIKGPTFDVSGHSICPLEFGAKAVLDFSGLSKNITIDEKNKKVHVILGKKNKDGSASIVQTTDMCDASWSQQYNEIKDLYKSMTGLTPSGSNRKGNNNWNKFEKLKGELNRMDCDMFIKASLECVAYLDFDYQQGVLRLSEGGFIESASLGTDFKYPIIGNCLYTTLGLTGSETGTIKATISSTGQINPYLSIKPSITAKASITGEIPFLCKAEGGVDATLAVLLQTFDPKLAVSMSGNIFLNASVLNYSLIDWSRPYLDVELYPEFKDNLNTYSLMSVGDTYENIYDNAASMPRDYLNTISLFSLGDENTLYNQNGVYPYNDAQLVRLSGNAMMLLWTGDDGTKSDINRTSLMYSIYKDGEWSETQKIAEDGTATGSFKAVSDGDKAYIVYQKLSQALDDNTSVDDMLAATDLYVVKYENGAFNSPICLNDYDNTAYESISDINLDGDNLTVAWIENSVNDIFLSEGTTSIRTRSIENTQMNNVSTISDFSAADNQYPGDVHIADDTIYYAVYDASVEEKTADLYTYSNAVSEKLLDADKIYNIQNIGNTLYYIRNSSIYKLENGMEAELGLDNITSFEVVSNGGYCSLLMSVCNGARNEIYISNLTNGEWSQAERFTDLGKYIRSYSPFMYDDGTINLAVSAAEVNDNIEEGESVYGNTSIMVLNQCDYCDISTSYVYYEEDEIQPNSDMNLYFDVNNDSSNSLNSVKVKLTDENENQLDEQTVECAIAPFSTEKLNIKYRLPQNISKTHLNLTVSIDGEEKDYSNNTVTTEFGYTNISVSPIECTVNKNNTADIKSTISNTGFEDAENVVVKIYNGNINDDVLDEINIGTMAVGETYDLEYTFPEELMVSPDVDIMNAVYVQAEASSVESLYSDNEQKVAFDSYVKIDSSISSLPTANTLTYTGEEQALVIAGTAEGGTMQYSIDGENYSVDIPTAINAGKYTVYYKVVGAEGYNDVEPNFIDITIEPLKEDMPYILIDFENETLTGFGSGSYTIGNAEVTPTDGKLSVVDYIGKTISIVKKARNDNYADSEAQLLTIPDRPAAPSGFETTKTHETESTGTISGIMTSMEYSTDNGKNWIVGTGETVMGLGEGTYLIRIKATSETFSSIATRVTITKDGIHSITYHLDGGEIESISQYETYTEGTSMTLPIPTKAGYTFDGWYDNANLTGEAVTEILSTDNTNKELWTKWIKNPEYIEVLDDFINKLTIEKITGDNGDISLKITAKDSNTLSELKLYSAVYNGNKALKSVSVLPYSADDDGNIIIPLSKPQIVNGETYKLMLWDNNQKPVIKAIDNELLK